MFTRCIVAIVKILNIGTDRSKQTVQTQIRLLLMEQSDQGLQSLPFHLHHLDTLQFLGLGFLKTHKHGESHVSDSSEYTCICFFFIIF